MLKPIWTYDGIQIWGYVNPSNIRTIQAPHVILMLLLFLVKLPNLLIVYNNITDYIYYNYVTTIPELTTTTHHFKMFIF